MMAENKDWTKYSEYVIRGIETINLEIADITKRLHELDMHAAADRHEIVKELMTTMQELTEEMYQKIGELNDKVDNKIGELNEKIERTNKDTTTISTKLSVLYVGIATIVAAVLSLVMNLLQNHVFGGK